MARNKYEQSFINKIVQEYNEGKTKSQIKKEYGLQYSTMNHWINNQNSIDVGNVKYSNDIREKVLSDYQQGKSVPELSKQYQIKTGTIYSWTKEANISRSKGVKSLCNNIEYFDTIDTEMKAYMLGFIIADGNVSIHNNQYSLKIKIQRQDRYLLEKLLEELDCTNAITDTREKTTFAKTEHDYSGISITSRHLVESLINLKVIPAKTGYEEMPVILKHLERHMIRGFFDGDGIACCTDKNHAFGFVGNGFITQQILQMIGGEWEQVTQHPHWITKNLYQTTTSKESRIKHLYHYMYDNSSFYLVRKHDKFLRKFKTLAVLGQHYRRPKMISAELSGNSEMGIRTEGVTCK